MPWRGDPTLLKDLPSKRALSVTLEPVPCPHGAPCPRAGVLRGVRRLVPLLALELIRASPAPGRAPAAASPGGGQLSMETAV